MTPMADTALETLLRRDRLIVVVSLLALTGITWLYILWLAVGMEAMAHVPASGDGMSGDMAMGTDEGMAMDMSPGAMASMADVAFRPWSVSTFAYAFVMWAVMMVGMMTPSATPMILLFARVGRQAALDDRPFAATGFFAGGYLTAWVLFAALATLGQWLLESALLLTPMLASGSRILSGIILISVGLFQWTALKDACLRQCQAPLMFIQSHGGFRRDAGGAYQLGLLHGLYCVGCCWALMALLFIGGVMNVLWIAVIAIFVLAEKVVPGGRMLSRVAGAAVVMAGLWQLAAMT
ncbi:metal-binding protein [Ensifer sp. Root1252]|nr:metal-binding protein [Ensifer sp. Root1252]KQY75706.1 metal-binding protein [Ensifer sp. Root142]KRC84120.1 metal-binding protein [Ensifer sp. Root231]KRD04475.1 metal-binding protein [Ensifer sp. Root258]OMQ43407.1 metal-binding protein [Ensifer sp. 1H6]